MTILDKISMRDMDYLLVASKIIDNFHPFHNLYVMDFFHFYEIEIHPEWSALENLMQITDLSIRREYFQVFEDDLHELFPPAIIGVLTYFHLLKN